MVRYADVALGEEAAAALELLVDELTRQVLSILEAAQVDEQLCSICLYQGQEPELDVVPLIFAGRARDRARIVQESDPEDWTACWNAFAYDDEDDVIHPRRDEDGDLYVPISPAGRQAWELLEDALDERVEDAASWVLARVAHRLNRSPLPAPTTSDVAVWVFEETFGQDVLIEQLTFVLTDETYAALRRSGVIGEDEEAPYRL